MNNCTFLGRFTKDPVIKYYPKGDRALAVVKFSLAVKNDKKNPNSPYGCDFVNFVAYDKTAEIIANFTAKGDMISIVSRYTPNSYTNDEKRKIIKPEFTVDKFEFVSKAKKVETPNTTPTTNNYSTSNNPGLANHDIWMKD